MAGANFTDSISAAVFGNSVTWSLTNLDAFVEETIEGQFQAQGAVEDVSTAWAPTSVPGRPEPHMQWLHGESNIFTFRALLYEEKFVDVIDILTDETGLVGKVNAIRRTVRYDSSLGRPPKWRFAWGDIEFDCIVESVGGVAYGEIRSDGKPRSVEFNITLRRIDDPLSLTATDPTIPEHLSRHKPIGHGQTFETLAGQQYGRPSWGVILRHISTKAFPAAGVIAQLPEKSYFRTRKVGPKTHTLDSSDASQNAINAVIARREVSYDMPHVLESGY